MTPEPTFRLTYLQPAFGVSPELLLPLPKEVRTTQRVTKLRGKTAIITESLYKNELVEQQNTQEKWPAKET